MGEYVCKDHSGVCAHLVHLEEDVKELFIKWDGIQRVLIGTLISTILSFIGIMFMLFHTIITGGGS